MVGYPPVSHMLAVQIFSRSEESGRRLAEKLSASVRSVYGITAGGRGEEGSGQIPELQLIGPGAASIGKINDIFRFVFYLKCTGYDKLVRIKDMLEEEMQGGQASGDMVQFDFDPVNTL